MIKIAWLLEAERRHHPGWQQVMHTEAPAHSVAVDKRSPARVTSQDWNLSENPLWVYKGTIKQLLLSRDFQLSGGPGNKERVIANPEEISGKLEGAPPTPILQVHTVMDREA